MKKLLILPAAILFFSSIFSACYHSGSRYDLKPRDDRYGNRRDENESFERFPKANKDIPTIVRAKSLPWESWSPGRDLGGQPIKESAVLTGDAYVAEGQRVQALKEYRSVNLNKLTAETRAAVIYRIASMQLAVDQPKKSLASLAMFFEKSKAEVQDVDPRFSLLFAYAYGRTGELDQAFAWFSRVNQLAAGNGGLHDAAGQGVRMLARSIPDEQYQTVVQNWSTDSFVHSLLGQETRRRSSGGIKVVSGAGRPFWLTPEVEVVAIDQTVGTGRYTVAVLLPLSGRYASLGKATKNGVELAFEGDGSNIAKVVFKDTGGDRVRAAALVQELSFMDDPPVVIGPLLSTTADIVADTARQKGLPVLTLTKSASFVAGRDVYRLGPTVMSQVETLMEAAVDQKKIRNFAFVYPEDEQSRDFVEAARQELLDRGLAPVYEASYGSGTFTSFTAIAEQLAQNDERVQAVFFPDTIEAATRFRYQLPEQFRRRLLMLGTARWNKADELRRSRKAMEGVMFVSPFFEFSDNPFVKQFQETYKAKFGKSADFLAAQGFDAATLVMAALKRAERSGEAFTTSIGAIDIYAGLTGEMTVMPSGEVRRRFVVVELKPGGLEKLPQQSLVKTDTVRGQYDFE
jgi:branched-chain amino acid transport system substrate-binding protein